MSTSSRVRQASFILAPIQLAIGSVVLGGWLSSFIESRNDSRTTGFWLLSRGSAVASSHLL